MAKQTGSERRSYRAKCLYAASLAFTVFGNFDSIISLVSGAFFGDAANALRNIAAAYARHPVLGADMTGYVINAAVVISFLLATGMLIYDHLDRRRSKKVAASPPKPGPSPKPAEPVPAMPAPSPEAAPAVVSPVAPTAESTPPASPPGRPKLGIVIPAKDYDLTALIRMSVWNEGETPAENVRAVASYLLPFTDEGVGSLDDSPFHHLALKTVRPEAAASVRHGSGIEVMVASADPADPGRLTFHGEDGPYYVRGEQWYVRLAAVADNAPPCERVFDFHLTGTTLNVRPIHE